MDDTQHPPPTPEDYLRIAQHGAEFWNRWLRAALDGIVAETEDDNEKRYWQNQIVELRLLDVVPLTEPEWRRKGFERVPALVRLGEHEMPTVTFVKIDFRQAPVDFRGFSFPSHIRFDGATFGDLARFDGATFGDSAQFDGATFGLGTRFAGATFGDSARFAGATFGNLAHFDGATFGDWAGFNGTTFGDGARFADATFGDWAYFGGQTGGYFKASLQSIAGRTLRDTKARDAWVEKRLRAAKPNEFRWISFAGARFRGNCFFIDRTFAGPAGFQAARFDEPPEFAGTDGHGFIDPHGMTVSFPRRWWWPFANSKVRSEMSARIRRLRKIMADIHAQDVERDLFILERRAERAIAWNGVAAKPWYLTPWRFLKALGLTLLQIAYQLLSNFGRSIVLPLGWLVASVAGFHAAYWHYWAKPVRSLSFLDRDLVAYSLGNLLPFVNALSPARADLLKRLFCKTAADGSCLDPVTILVPLRVELLALGEGIFNAVLLFLLLQAIRNYFKMK